MKNIKQIILFCSFLTLYNCAELSSALSNYNQSQGGQCARLEALNYLYNEDTGKYESGKIFTKDRNGYDIKYKEKNWANNTMDSYLNRGVFTSYYKTSPYSGGKYKFVIHCASWH